MAKVLIVDDSSMIRKMLRNGLKNNHEVVEAQNGEEALEIIEDGDVELVISDLNMPVMNGFDLVQRIRDDSNDVPVVIVSSEVDGDTRKKFEALNVKVFIQKPFVPETLRDAIKQVFNQ